MGDDVIFRNGPAGCALGRARTKFVPFRRDPTPPIRSQYAVSCSHEGFHAIRSWYDRQGGVIVYYWTCEHCGALLREARREPYRPHFDPQGWERFMAVLPR
jgi:hypothetical protein